MEIDVKEYIDREIEHLEDKVNLITRENVRALKKASVELNRRLKGMNEFRAQLDKQTRSFITCDEFRATRELLEQKITNLSRILYIGIGVVLVLEIILRIV